MNDEPKKVKTKDFDKYLAETQGLELDYIEELLISRKKAWYVTSGLGLITILALIAAIAGLKRQAPPPFILRVDNSTGAVDVITTIRESEVSYGEVIDIYWLNKYVLNRESYDYNNVQMLYDTTALLSTPEVQKEYYAIYERPGARDEVLGDSTRIIVSIKSITPVKEIGQATVRFTTQERKSNGQNSTPKNLIATISYKYLNAPMKAEDRRINPLGFQITSYRVDPEVISN